MGTGLLAWLVSRWSDTLPRIISLAGTLLFLGIVLYIWFSHPADQQWIIHYTHSWIPSFGIRITLAADGLSLLMLLLTAFLGVLCVLVSWKEIKTRVGFFHFNLLFITCACHL